MPISDDLFITNCRQWATSSAVSDIVIHTTCDKVFFCQSEDGSANLRYEDGKTSFDYHSSTNPEEEARQWWAALKLKNTEVLYVYGVGLGYVYDAALPWLRENMARSLVFLEDDPQVIHRLLETQRGTQLVQDRQVALHLISAQLQEIEDLLLPYAMFSAKVSFLEAYFHSKKNQCLEIKSMIAFFTDYHRASIQGYAQGGLYFFNNYFRNMLKLPRAFNAGPLAGKFKDIPAIICGAGPSLDKNIDVLLKLQDRALIFAGGTAINALNARGIIPHVGAGIDPNPEQLTRLIMNQGYEMPFFYRNRINHQALEIMHGDKICVAGSSGFEIGSWMEKKLGIAEQHISEGYNVLNFALAQAYAMGCNPIIIVGVDLAYSQGLSYASNIRSHPLHDRKTNFRTKSLDETLLNKKDIYGSPVQTLWKWIRESLWYSWFAQKHADVQLINATEGGIGFPGVPNKTLAEVAAQYLVKHFDLGTRLHGEIQNTQWQSEITETKVVSLLRQLSQSSKNCLEKCARIENELCISLNALDKEANARSEAIHKSIQELHAEEAFQAMLNNIDVAYLRFTSLEQQRLKREQGQIAAADIAARQQAFDLKRYGLLKKSAYSHMLLIDSILEENESRKMHALATQPSHPADSLQALSEEKYAFDEQFLTLHDPALELNYSETFPTGAYLCQERQWYPNGALKTQQFFHGVLLHGPSSFFSEKGQLLAKSWFIHGQQQGKMRTCFASGQLHSLQSFRDGQRHGLQEYFYANGLLKTKMHYHQGHLHGIVQLFHANGQLSRELSYINGQPDGLERFWDENGHLLIEVTYREGLPIGTARQWHKNGQLACQIIYDDHSQKLSGQHWTPEGNLTSEDKAKESTYFEGLSQYAGNLTHSLENVLSQVYTLLPNIAGSPGSPMREDAKADITYAFKELQDEMTHLQKLSQALQRESLQEIVQTSGLAQESQTAFEQQLQQEHQKMADQMQSIDQHLKNMLKGLTRNNEDPPK